MFSSDLHILPLIPGSFSVCDIFQSLTSIIEKSLQFEVLKSGVELLEWSACVVGVKTPLSRSALNLVQWDAIFSEEPLSRSLQEKPKPNRIVWDFTEVWGQLSRWREREEEQKEMFTCSAALFVLLSFKPRVTSLWRSFHPPCELCYVTLCLPPPSQCQICSSSLLQSFPHLSFALLVLSFLPSCDSNLSSSFCLFYHLILSSRFLQYSLLYSSILIFSTHPVF